MIKHISCIGIDSVDIARFQDWHTYSQESLLRIFSQQEIDYCLSVPIKSAERFAARFAVREAFIKALFQMFSETNFSLLTICKAIQVTKLANGSPQLIVDWQKLSIEKPKDFSCSVSWTHTKSVATAIVQIN
jgi:holo-[acyl-carrier protein] synthase